MSAALSPWPIFRGEANDGTALVGGQLFTYVAGTTTPQATYVDSTQTTPNTNPVILNSRGEANVWLDSTLTYKFVLQDSAGNPIWTVDQISGAGALIQNTVTASYIGQLLYPRTAAEIAAGITPTFLYYPPGNPRRYGAVGDGVTNDTAALAACISCNKIVNWYPGDTYGVTSITFPGQQSVYFNGGAIRGIATGPTSAAVIITGNFAEYRGFNVNLTGINGNPTPNPNYTTAIWWANNIGSQFNTLFGCTVTSAVRAMVHGQLPGNAPISTIQSENKIYGFQTNGVANPFYGNSVQGFLHFSDAIFTTNTAGWTTPGLPATSRALENPAGALFLHGGELVFSSSVTPTWGAELQTITLEEAYLEGASPILIIGDNVRMSNCRYYVLPAGVSGFSVQSGATGILNIFDSRMYRNATVGATDNSPMIDASPNASTFEVNLNGTESFEWAWRQVNGNCSLVKRGALTTVRYTHHRLNITGADANVYILDSNPSGTLYGDAAFDHMGYTTTGWMLHTSAGGTTLASTTSTGPTGYLSSQITLTATGQALATSVDTTSLATTQATSIHVRPNEGYWLSAWVKMSSGAISQLVASFYDLTGAGISSIPAADQNAIGSNVWSYVEGPVVAPANAAYMAIGINTTGVATILVTDIRARKAN